jgi:putative superfamily III holin-X
MATVEDERTTRGPTFVGLIGDIAAGARDLAAAHGVQLREEVRTEAGRAGTAGIELIAAAIIGALGAVFLLVAVVMVFIEVVGWPAWASWLLVGGILAIGGLILGAVGYRQWSAVRFVPERTIHSFMESLSCLSNGKK